MLRDAEQWRLPSGSSVCAQVTVQLSSTMVSARRIFAGSVRAVALSAGFAVSAKAGAAGSPPATSAKNRTFIANSRPEIVRPC